MATTLLMGPPTLKAVNEHGSNPRQLFCLPDASCICNLTSPPAHSRAVWASDYVLPPSSAFPAPSSTGAAGDGNTKGGHIRSSRTLGSVQTSFVAFFNLDAVASIPSVLGALRSEVTVQLNAIRPAWGARSNCTVRDLWMHRNLGVVQGGAITMSLAIHDAALLSVSCHLQQHSEL